MARTVGQVLEEVYRNHPVPPAAHVLLTRRCNARCVHCFQVERTGDELTTDQWRTVFRRLADAGILLLTLSGGEPTLRPDLLDLVRAARALAFSVTLKTNGILLGDQTCDELSRLAVTHVHISLYSADAATHDRITGIPGSHARSLGAARRLKANGARVRLSCTLLDDNFDDYRGVLALAESEGLSHLLDPSVVLCENGCEQPGLRRLSSEQLVRFFRDPLTGKKPGPLQPRETLLAREVCRIGRASAGVMPNGDVTPCAEVPERLGNLLDRPLNQIWIGNPIVERYASIRWADLPACRDCRLLAFCARCHAEAMREHGDLLGPSRLACGAAQARAVAGAARDPTGVAPPDESGRLSPAVEEGVPRREAALAKSWEEGT
jgi:pyrroloquinoline quinone biosynthesis protein E